MNIVLLLRITGLSGIFTRGPGRPAEAPLRPLPVAEPLIPEAPKAAPVRYVTAQTNAIYCAAVRLGKALRKAREAPYEHDALADLSMEIHKTVVEFGQANHIKADVLLGSLDTIEQVATLHGGNPAWDGDARSDVEFVSRALPLIHLFTQDTSTGLAEWFRNHPGEGLRAAFTPGSGEEIVRKAQQRLDAAALGPWIRTSEPEQMIAGDKVTIISTTATAVKVHRDDAEPFTVDLARIPSPLALSRWACQLSRKEWATGKTIRAFIEAVSLSKGWDVFSTEEEQPAA